MSPISDWSEPYRFPDNVPRRGGARNVHQRIVRHLARCLTDPDPSRDWTPGFAAAELSRLSEEFQLRILAQSFAQWGGPIELREIVWWGSAFGDIARTAANAPVNPHLLRDAGLFNLGVALFDRVVDEYPSRATPLIDSLRPDRLELRLEQPTDDAASLQCQVLDLGLITALFDAALSSAGCYLRADPDRVEQLLRMLSAMYHSELGDSGPLAAKALPVQFIGALAAGPDQTDATRLFGKLSEFVALWDDWTDLSRDLLCGDSNAFLTPTSRVTGPARFTRLLRGLSTICSVHVSPGQVVRVLSSPLEGTMDAARRLGPATCGKTVWLCRHLLGLVRYEVR